MYTPSGSVLGLVLSSTGAVGIISDSGEGTGSFLANFGSVEYKGTGEIEMLDVARCLEVMEFIPSSSSDEEVGVGGIGKGFEIKFIGGVRYDAGSVKLIAELVLFRVPGYPCPGGNTLPGNLGRCFL